MNYANKIEELKSINIRQCELIGELKSFLKNRVASLRKFENGTIVDVFVEGEKKKGTGIIMSSFLSAGLEPYDVSSYIKNPEKWEKGISEVFYIVNKMKKDGTSSAHRLAVCSESRPNTGSYYTYCKPITTKY